MWKLWYQYEHDGLIRWVWMDYIKDRHRIKNINMWFEHHPEACFEYITNEELHQKPSTYSIPNYSFEEQ